MLYYNLALLLLYCLLSMLNLAVMLTAGAAVNRTIDDQHGDSSSGAAPLFLPDGAWNIGQTCTACAFRVNNPINVSEVFDGTWHDAMHIGATDPDPVTVQVNFTGHAVYVYHVVVNYLTYGIVTSTNLAFYIDNESVGFYTHVPTGTKSENNPPIFYKVPVYTNDSLVEGDHTLMISASGDMETLMLFDYVVYTTEDDSGSASPPSSQPYSPLPSQISSSPVSLPMSSPRSTSAHSFQSGTLSPGPTNSSTFSSQTPSLSATVNQPNSQSQSSGNSNGSHTPLPPRGARSGGHIAAIAGGTAGGIALAAAVVSCYVLRRRHMRQKKRLQSEPLIVDKELADMLEMSSRVDLLEGHDDQTVAAQAERFNYLVQRIRTLLAEVDGRRNARNNVLTSDQLAPIPAPSAAEVYLSSALTALRAEMSALRTELGEKCVLFSSETLPPSYQA
ncbi:hypothetical protein GY45DRAFT_1322422 [Cubamyces sp. BRFM 1775]|nr:hypothetical protein GY45DRAFT_1322422 [Cubamyces sp. BRFM 1775]